MQHGWIGVNPLLTEQNAPTFPGLSANVTPVNSKGICLNRPPDHLEYLLMTSWSNTLESSMTPGQPSRPWRWYGSFWSVRSQPPESLILSLQGKICRWNRHMWRADRWDMDDKWTNHNIYNIQHIYMYDKPWFSSLVTCTNWANQRTPLVSRFPRLVVCLCAGREHRRRWTRCAPAAWRPRLFSDHCWRNEHVSKWCFNWL